MTKIVTTSWDDGSRDDLATADLLREYGVGGTFYVHSQSLERKDGLTRGDLIDLGGSFEIGAHTRSHRDLTALTDAEVVDETRSNRSLLEEITGNRVEMFCFPGGRYDDRVVRLLKPEGFLGMRTTDAFFTNIRRTAPLMPVTLHAFPHLKKIHMKHAIKYGNWDGFMRYMFRLKCAKDWKELACRLFDIVLKEGGVWHLWGHSWEMEELRLWSDVREVLEYVSRRKGVHYLSNGATMRRIHG